MKKTMKKLFCVLVAATLGASWLAGCAKTETPTVPQEGLTPESVDIWSCDATVKVLQAFMDPATEERQLVPEGYYDDVKRDARISITMAKGEYESGQVVITPTVDVGYYNATVSDLKHVDGEATISKENIDVYHERYMPLAASHANTKVSAGWYPDALVPMHAAVEYGHTTVKANENQGIYVTVETAVEQEVGQYTGTLTLDFEKFTQEVPVTVNVMDVAVSEETHIKSVFLAHWNFDQGELDTTQRAYESYLEAMKEYRLAVPTYREKSFTSEWIAEYADTAYEQLLDGLSTVQIPLQVSSGQVFSKSALQSVLRALMEKSFEKDYNILEKSVCYNAALDEPKMTGVKTSLLTQSCTLFNQTLNELADAYEADDSITATKKAEIIQSLREVPHIITSYMADDYKGYVDTYCPLYSHLGSASQREEYRNDSAFKELWWYGCNNPVAPYVSFHLEHEDTLSPRMLGWMSAEYNIDGIINWATNYINVREDYFDFSAPYKGSGPHMEGQQWYPGGQYGLDEPIPSLRIAAIRDGLEEYELLYALREKYEENGLDFESFCSALTDMLYSDAQVTAQVDAFVAARQTLLEASVALQGPAQLCLIESKDLGNGTVETKVYAKSGYEITNHGAALTGGEAYGEGYVYTIVSTLDKDYNSLKLEYTVGGKTYVYNKALPGKATILGAAEFYQSFTEGKVGVTSTLVDGNAFGLSGQLAKLDMSASAADEYQMINFNDSAVFGRLNASINKMVFAVYNDAAEDVTLKLSIKYKKEKLYQARPDVVLASKQITYIEISVGTVVWDKSGAMENIRMTFGGTEGQPARTVYVKDLILFNN